MNLSNEQSKTSSRPFWETPRDVTHEEAKEAAMRFIDGNFKNDNEPPRISIPANPDRDDDLVLLSYIAQQRRLRTQPSPREVALERLLEQAQACILGDTPEDMTHEDARQDTLEKIKRALASDGREGE